VSATRIGTAVAYVLGSVMVGAGISTFAFGIAAGGLWLAVMGWFLTGAARAEAQQVIARERLGGLRLRDVMVADPVTVEADASIGQVIDEVARRHRHSTYPVLEEGRPVGLLPFRCVAATPRDEWDERRVRDCMVARADVPTLSEEALAADAFDDLAATDLHRALVVADGHLAGIVSITDLIRTAGVEARAAHE
jgi:CBS domain-containing protein